MFLKVDRREPEARRGRIIFRKSKQVGTMSQGYGILHDMQAFSPSVKPRGPHLRKLQKQTAAAVCRRKQGVENADVIVAPLYRPAVALRAVQRTGYLLSVGC